MGSEKFPPPSGEQLGVPTRSIPAASIASLRPLLGPFAGRSL